MLWLQNQISKQRFTILKLQRAGRQSAKARLGLEQSLTMSRASLRQLTLQKEEGVQTLQDQVATLRAAMTAMDTRHATLKLLHKLSHALRISHTCISALYMRVSFALCLQYVGVLSGDQMQPRLFPLVFASMSPAIACQHRFLTCLLCFIQIDTLMV